MLVLKIFGGYSDLDRGDFFRSVTSASRNTGLGDCVGLDHGASRERHWRQAEAQILRIMYPRDSLF